MRINPLSPAADVTQSGSVARPSDSPGPAAGSTGGLAPSSELLQLQATLRQVPDVRPDLLREVAQRLAAGEYRKPQALVGAVKAMLDSQPG